MEWTHANWAVWKAEQPAWFTEGIIAGIPEKIIPDPQLQALNATGGKRQRSSVAIADPVRESMRRNA